MTEPLVEVMDLEKFFPVKLPALQRVLMREAPVVHAVDGVSFSLRSGEIFGLVGESGCGKTTVGRTVLRLLEPTAGTIRFDGFDITHMREAALRPFRRAMQVIFQDPHASLNPAMTIGQSIADPLLIHGVAEETEAKEAVLAIMTEVGLSPAEQLYSKYPGDLSGGQKQRAVIARAMILQPKFIVADEPVAMLDMSIRAKILELMLELKEKYGLTYLFITHDLATAKFICDRIAIMYLGRIVEAGDAKEIYRDPKHPYTQALLGAIPSPDPDRRRFKALPKGEVPDAIYPPAGCRFHPRCPVATPTCGWEPQDVFDFLDRRALDAQVGQADLTALGPRSRMRADGQAFRILSRPVGLDPDVRRKLILSVVGAGAAYLLLSIPIGAGVLAAGLLEILLGDVMERRSYARSNPRAVQSESIRTRMEEVMKAAPDPLRTAAGETAALDDEVRVEFPPAEDPGLRSVGEREVRCVLY